MTGIHVPAPPTDRPPTSDHSRPALDGLVPPTPRADAHSRLLAIAVILLVVIAVVLGALLVSTVSERAGLAADNARLTTENNRLLTDNERLVAANEELTAEFREWQDELFGWSEYEPGDPVELFAEGPVEQLIVDVFGTYTFDVEAGQLLELAVAGDGDAFYFVELLDDSRRFVSFAPIGSFADDGFRGYGFPEYGARDHAWFLLEQEGSYELTIHGEGMNDPDEVPAPLTAQLHLPPEESARVVDVSEPYPIDDELPIHSFEGRAGQLAIITMTSGRPEVLDPYIRLYGPDGALIGQDDDGAGNLDARLVLRLPEDGLYEIEADTYHDGFSPRNSREVPYTLTVDVVEID